MLFGTAARLAEQFRLVCLHYVEGGEVSYAALARTVADCVASLDCGPVVLLAESFGGAVALQTALDHGDRVAALMVVNSFARYPKRFGLACTRLVAPILHPFFRPLRNTFGVAALFGAYRDPELMAAFRARAGSGMGRAYRQRLRMIQRLDLLPRLGEVEQPVALLAAERDRVVPSVRCGRVMQERLPNATLDLLAGAGHLVLPIDALGWGDRLTALWQRAMPGDRAAPVDRSGGA